MSRTVLGINWYAHDASAALCRDGRIVFAAAEERFSRLKKDNGFPRRAISAALTVAGIEPGQLDGVAFGWNAPYLTPLHTLRLALTGKLPLRGDYVPRSLSGLVSEGGRLNGAYQFRRHFGTARDGVRYIDHHLAHAYSAWCVSGFDEAAVLVIDGRGAYQATSLYHARGNALELVRTIPYPNSIGLLYESFTDWLGFERHNDEWKVMGLAAYGEPSIGMQDYVRVTADGYSVNTAAIMG